MTTVDGGRRWALDGTANWRGANRRDGRFRSCLIRLPGGQEMLGKDARRATG